MAIISRKWPVYKLVYKLNNNSCSPIQKTQLNFII